MLPDGLVDAVVVGGGAAGLNAALMLARSRRSVVVLDAGSPRNAPAEGVHGLLGHDGVPPAELLRRGRAEVRSYGGLVVPGDVVSAEPAPSTTTGDLRFTLALADGRTVTARRVVVATGTRDELPDVPGLAEHWGGDVVHCPYCHGWEVRDEPVAVLATGPAAAHQTLLFRQLTDDVVLLVNGTALDDEARERFAARGVDVVDGRVTAVESHDGRIAGVRLEDGRVVPRRVVVVATRLHARLAGLEGLGLPTEELPDGSSRVVVGPAGTTAVPGVWAAGNVAEPYAQVGASAAAGAMAGAHVNADLAQADTDAALAAVRAAATSGGGR